MSTLKTGNITHPSSTGTAITLDASDNVGIGQGTPTATLDVNGTIKLDGNYPVGSNNVALGDAALDDGSLSGDNNTAVGDNALSNNNTGSKNIAIGSLAMIDNTTGSNNTAVGSGEAGVLQGALGLNTTGSKTLP